MTKNETLDIRIETLTTILKTFELVGSPAMDYGSVRTHQAMCNSIRGYIEILRCKKVDD